MWSADFLWRLRGSVELSDTMSDDMTIDRLNGLCERQLKNVTGRESDSIVFYEPLWAGIFRSKGYIGSNLLALVIFERGQFSIVRDSSGRHLRYELESLHGFIFCLSATILFFAIGVGSNGLLGGVELAALVFGWLYGMNILLALFRIPGTIRRAVRNH